MSAVPAHPGRTSTSRRWRSSPRPAVPPAPPPAGPPPVQARPLRPQSASGPSDPPHPPPSMHGSDAGTGRYRSLYRYGSTGRPWIHHFGYALSPGRVHLSDERDHDQGEELPGQHPVAPAHDRLPPAAGQAAKSASDTVPSKLHKRSEEHTSELQSHSF